MAFFELFTTTVPYVEVNGEIYSRVGSTVIRFSSNGLKMEQSYYTFSLTDHKGNIRVRYYKSGWLGNQYVKILLVR